MNTVNDAKKIDFQQATVELEVFDILKARPHAQAGAGDEMVKRAMFIYNFPNKIFAVVRVGDIAGKDERALSAFDSSFFQALLITGHQRHTRTLYGKLAREAQTKTA